MTYNPEPVAQWTLDLTIYHHPRFQHRALVKTLGKRGGWVEVGRIEWTGLGIPEPALEALVARVDAVISEHFVTRYGIQGVLDTHWAGEADTS